MQPTETAVAIKKRHPEGVALIVCKDKTGKVNITPIGWFMLCSSNPSCWAIALYEKHFSHAVIGETKEFVLCLPSGMQKKDILYCGSVHGWDTDKLKSCTLQTLPSKTVAPPIIEDCIACFECKVISTHKTPDHTIFVGEVQQSYTSEKKDKVYNRGSRDLFDWKLE